MKLFKLLTILLAFIPSLVSSNSSLFTLNQIKNLSLAREISIEIGLFPELLLGAILIQESGAGYSTVYKKGSIDGPHVGIAQVGIAAARSVIKHITIQKYTDAQLKLQLATDDEFNIRVAAYYLLQLQEFGFTTPISLALAYNAGPGGAKRLISSKYSRSISSHLLKLYESQNFFISNRS